MASSSPGNGARQQPVEYVDFGRPRRPGNPRLYWLLLACLLVAALVVAVRQSGRPGRPAPPPVAVTQIHPLLGISGSWQLIGLDSTGVVTIDFAQRQIIQTALPPPEGSGPVSFIVGPNSAIVRPLDDVPGYLVPDGQPPQRLTGILAHGGLLLPGPRPGQEWDTYGGGANSLVLIGANGRPTSTRITLPNRGWPAESAMADGRGDVLVANVSGNRYDAGPHWLHRVTALLSAVGPSRWLGMTCKPDGSCQDVVLNPATGSQRTLPGPPLQLLSWPWPAYPGSVAPNGRIAAVVIDSGSASSDGDSQVRLEQISLATGAVRPIPVPVSQTASSQTMAWSPDSQWLFVLAATGKLLAVSMRTGKVQSLGVQLPGLSQLAIRDASG